MHSQLIIYLLDLHDILVSTWMVNNVGPLLEHVSTFKSPIMRFVVRIIGSGCMEIVQLIYCSLVESLFLRLPYQLPANLLVGGWWCWWWMTRIRKVCTWLIFWDRPADKSNLNRTFWWLASFQKRRLSCLPVKILWLPFSLSTCHRPWSVCLLYYIILYCGTIYRRHVSENIM